MQKTRPGAGFAACDVKGVDIFLPQEPKSPPFLSKVFRHAAAALLQASPVRSTAQTSRRTDDLLHCPPAAACGRQAVPGVIQPPLENHPAVIHPQALHLQPLTDSRLLSDNALAPAQMLYLQVKTVTAVRSVPVGHLQSIAPDVCLSALPAGFAAPRVAHPAVQARVVLLQRYPETTTGRATGTPPSGRIPVAGCPAPRPGHAHIDIGIDT